MDLKIHLLLGEKRSSKKVPKKGTFLVVLCDFDVFDPEKGSKNGPKFVCFWLEKVVQKRTQKELFCPVLSIFDPKKRSFFGINSALVVKMVFFSKNSGFWPFTKAN